MIVLTVTGLSLTKIIDWYLDRKDAPQVVSMIVNVLLIIFIVAILLLLVTEALYKNSGKRK
jgi:competence protein ComGC